MGGRTVGQSASLCAPVLCSFDKETQKFVLRAVDEWTAQGKEVAVEVSNRHIHLTDSDVEHLFGKGYASRAPPRQSLWPAAAWRGHSGTVLYRGTEDWAVRSAVGPRV